MLMKLHAAAGLYLAADETAGAPPEQPAGNAPQQEWATLGGNAPIAWPSGAAKVPVTGELSPHAKAALERMGVTQKDS